MTYTFDFIRIKSYEGDKSTGNGKCVFFVSCVVRVDGTTLDNLKGRHVIVVEDIIDTGNTLKKFIPMLEEKGVASVSVCVTMCYYVLPCVFSCIDLCAL